MIRIQARDGLVHIEHHDGVSVIACRAVNPTQARAYAQTILINKSADVTGLKLKAHTVEQRDEFYNWLRSEANKAEGSK